MTPEKDKVEIKRGYLNADSSVKNATFVVLRQHEAIRYILNIFSPIENMLKRIGK